MSWLVTVRLSPRRHSLPLSRPAQVIQRQGVRPVITPESAPFWKAANRGELIVERCPECGLHLFPPHGICRRCLRRELEWTRVEAPGVLVSWTVNHHAWSSEVEAVYGLGLVEFPRCSDVRFVGFLDGFDDPPMIGTLVDYAFEASAKGIPRLYYTPWENS
jgi:uncharacterized OB-fold protein